MKTLINVEQINAIYIYPQKESDRFKWFNKEKKLFGLYVEKEGFWATNYTFASYTIAKDEFVSKDFINSLKDYKTEGKKCYNKAHIVIYSSKVINDKYFDSDEEMYNYLAQPELKNIKFIEL